MAYRFSVLYPCGNSNSEDREALNSGPMALQLPHLSQERRLTMPEKKTIERARADARQGKAPTTQAGEFVREEMEHIRQGKHGARSAKQAIAIGLSKARRAGVDLPPPEKGTVTP